VGIEHLPGLRYYGMVTLKLPLLEMSDWTSAPPHDDVTTGHWGYSLARCILFYGKKRSIEYKFPRPNQKNMMLRTYFSLSLDEV
jgi:hypothetical protein